MKKLDELKFLLTSVFVINQTNGHKDGDISLILDYAFRRFYGANTNLFLLACAGKTKEQTDHARSSKASGAYAIQ